MALSDNTLLYGLGITAEKESEEMAEVRERERGHTPRWR